MNHFKPISNNLEPLGARGDDNNIPFKDSDEKLVQSPRKLNFLRLTRRRTTNDTSIENTGSFFFSDLIKWNTLLLPSSPENEKSQKVNEFGRRSCMKSSNRKNKKKYVSFGTAIRPKEKVKEYKIEPLFEFSSDLWWSKQELRSLQLKTEITSYEDITNREDYVNFLINARKQIYLSDKNECSEAKTKIRKHGKLSDQIFTGMVLWRSYGLAGTEHLNANYHQIRKEHMKHTVRAIVNVYDASAANFATDPKIQNRFATYARRMTSKDRYWGTVLGKADQAAISDKVDEHRIVKTTLILDSTND